MENYSRQMSKLHAANLSTWRAPGNSENAAKTAKIRNHVENGKKKYKSRAPRRQNTRNEARGDGRDQHRSPPRAATEPAREPGEEHQQGREDHKQKRQQRPAGRTRRNPNKGRTGPPAEEQRAENREDVDVRYSQAPWKNNSVSHQCQIRTRDCSTTLVHAVPPLSTHERPCTPDFGPGTSALRSYRVEVSRATAPLFSTASEQMPRMADSTGASLPSSDHRRTAQPE